MRIGQASRKTEEVNIEVEINLDLPGDYEIKLDSQKEEPTVVRAHLDLFEHLYQQIYHHGYFSGKVIARGDLPHHVIEDTAGEFGKAIIRGLYGEEEKGGKLKGLVRFGSLYVPFEGSLAFVAIDYSGRGYSVLDFGDIDNIGLRAMAQHTFETMAKFAEFNIYGYTKTVGTLRDDHHKLEAFSKAFGRVLHQVTRIYEHGREMVPSTKGTL